MVEEGSAQELGIREHVINGLGAMTRSGLVMVAMIRYPWFSFANSLYAAVGTNTNGQPETFRGITSAEDGSAVTTSSTAGPRTGCSNDSVNAGGQRRVGTILR